MLQRDHYWRFTVRSLHLGQFVMVIVHTLLISVFRLRLPLGLLDHAQGVKLSRLEQAHEVALRGLMPESDTISHATLYRHRQRLEHALQIHGYLLGNIECAGWFSIAGESRCLGRCKARLNLNDAATFSSVGATSGKSMDDRA